MLGYAVIIYVADVFVYVTSIEFFPFFDCFQCLSWNVSYNEIQISLCLAIVNDTIWNVEKHVVFLINEMPFILSWNKSYVAHNSYVLVNVRSR